jgi:glycine/D-amino acid oxidase-like deaminating enzyme
MAGKDDQYMRQALPLLREARLPFEELDPTAAAKRFPPINFDDVTWALYEREAGYLLARRACAVVVDNFVKEGGEYRQVAVTPGAIRQGRMADLALSDGSRLAADQYVFACGPWLGKMFPEVLGKLINPTRQEVFFFGTPAGDTRFVEERFPAWIDDGPRQFYGIPGNEGRGFKLACDRRGAPFDPTSGSRMPTADGLRAARDYLEFRFPALKGAPLVEARVCQYEDTPDTHFLIDRHPHAANVWLVGGGSGHGFKLGPALGERVAELVLGKRPVDPFFALSRFAK